MTETNPPAGPLTLAERIAQQIDWTPTCLPGTERATIVRQILDLSGVRDREQSAEHPVTRMERGIRTALFGTDAEVAAALAEPSGDTVQAPDVVALLSRCDAEDRSAGEFGWIQTTEIRALLGTDTTPDRLAWISEAGVPAAAERRARYQETACALRPAATSGDPDVADLAYARSEVDKWLASTDPYCILPTRTEHIPALLARLDELEGTR